MNKIKETLKGVPTLVQHTLSMRVSQLAKQ